MRRFLGRIGLSGWRDALNVAATILTILVCIGVLGTLALDARRRTPVVGNRIAAEKNSRPPARPNSDQHPLPVAPISLAGAAVIGNPAARVAILEYSDYQCPYCGAFARETFHELDKVYVQTGKVLFAYRDFPLESLHPNALSAAVSARCAREQNQFWPMQALMFQNQKALGDTKYREWATQLKVNPLQFQTCRNATTTERQVRADAASGQALGVTGTPTFFIGAIQPDGWLKVTERFSGAKPIEGFQAVLDPLISPVDKGRSGK